MRKLYFIRHGETEDNAAERWGLYDTPLNDTGRMEAAGAAKDARARGLHFDMIIASPQPRAIETARIIAAELGYNIDAIETLASLVERDMGPLSGMRYDSFFTGTKKYIDLDSVAGVETVEAMQRRAGRAFHAISIRPEEHILVVGHGAFGRAFRRVVKNLPYVDEYNESRPHNMIPNATIMLLL